MSLGFAFLAAALVLFTAGWTPVRAQAVSSASAASVRMTVTVESSHGNNPPVITRDDVMVYQGHSRDKVTDWVPAQGDRSELDLFLLIDDSANTTLGSQLDDIRQFIHSQPASTRVGVAYMQNGTADIVQDLTSDHAQAGKALRLPLGVPSANASPGHFEVKYLGRRNGYHERDVKIFIEGNP